MQSFDGYSIGNSLALSSFPVRPYHRAVLVVWGWGYYNSMFLQPEILTLWANTQDIRINNAWSTSENKLIDSGIFDLTVIDLD